MIDLSGSCDWCNAEFLELGKLDRERRIEQELADHGVETVTQATNIIL